MIKKIEIELKSGFELSMTIEEAEELMADLDQVLGVSASIPYVCTYTKEVPSKMETN